MTTAEAIAVPLDLDLATGRVTMPGRMLGVEMLQPNLESLLQGEATTFAVVVLSRGDRRPVDLGLCADGAPREVDVLAVKAAVKEFETGRRVDLHEGDGSGFQLVTRAGLPRYRFMISLSAGQIRRILQSYADPLGTYVDLIAELETQYRYNAADYSPGAALTQSVATGAQTVHVPVPLVQANGTRAYQLSVTGTVLPAGLSGGWGSLPIAILNQAINITVSGGAVVGAALSIPAGTRGVESPSTLFIPHWLTSLDPVRIDPATGGLALEIDIISQAMSASVFGAMPATVWRAEKVPCRNIWLTGPEGSFYTVSAPADTFTFLNASGGSLGSHTMVNGFAAPGSVAHAVGAFHCFVGRGNTYTTDLVWKTEPTAKTVRNWQGIDTPVVETPVPSGPSIRFDVQLVAEGAAEENEVTRVSSQSFVIRLRRDLIPDVAPPAS